MNLETSFVEILYEFMVGTVLFMIVTNLLKDGLDNARV